MSILTNILPLPVKFLPLLCAMLAAFPAAALTIDFYDKTPSENREWIDKNYIREQMDVVAAKICQALYAGRSETNRNENFTITFFPTPDKKGNPGFAFGRKLTWRVGQNPTGDASGGIGLLCHEMTHIFDFNGGAMSVQRFRKIFDSRMVESTAVYITDYFVKYGYVKCSSPSIILDRRYHALRYDRNWGGYRTGAGLLDFVEQTYGPGMGLKLIWEQQNGKKPWERLLGKNLDELLAEWRQMETIYDPVFQWNYNGTAAGAVRHDKNFCAMNAISAEDAADKSGAWLAGASAAEVKKVDDGCLTIALHGKFPKKGKAAIASLGAAKNGNGKALLLATTAKTDTLALYLIASVPGQGCKIVSATPIPVQNVATVPHSIILTVKDGKAAAVVVDGKPAAKIDMAAKCGVCTFSPVFAVGGMSGGFGVAGFEEPRGEGGVLLDDVRVFTRTFRPKEIKKYAEVFGSGYQGAVAVEAAWCGPQGGTDIANPENWTCFNSYGEKIVAVPSKDTVVNVWFKAIPSIPPKAKFVCKSFTIDGIAVLDEANVDLRGVRIVDLADNTRIITRNSHGLAVKALRGGRLRLDGSLAVTDGMKFAGNLELAAGSTLRLPENPEMAVAKSISVKDGGVVAIRPCKFSKNHGFLKLLKLEEMPEDLSNFRLDLSDKPTDAVFKPVAGGKFLGVADKKKRNQPRCLH